MNLVLEAMDETEAFLNTKGLDEQDWADQLKATQDFVRSVENGTNDDLKAPEEMEEEEEREEVEVDTIDVEVSNQDQRDSKSIYKLARTSGSVSMGLPDDDGEKEEQTEGRDGSEVDEAIARSVGDDRPGIATTLGVELGQRLMVGVVEFTSFYGIWSFQQIISDIQIRQNSSERRTQRSPQPRPSTQPQR